MKTEPERTIMIMGDTGSGKTTQATVIAKYFWKKYGWKTKFVSADPSGAVQLYDEGLIQEGGVDLFNISSIEHKIRYLSRISKGYWPNEDGEIKLSKEFAYSFEEYPIFIFDSISGMVEMLGEHVTQVSDSKAKIGFKLSTISEESSDEDEYKFGTMAEGHYNIVHKEIRKAFYFGFKTLPLKYFIATARIETGKDNLSTKCYFPKTIGKALSPEIPSWFQDFFHLEATKIEGDIVARHLNIKSLSDEKKQMLFSVVIAWFINHTDDLTGIKYPTKVRLAPSITEQVLNGRFKEGYIIVDLEFGLARFYQYLEKVVETSRNAKSE